MNEANVYIDEFAVVFLRLLIEICDREEDEESIHYLN